MCIYYILFGFHLLVCICDAAHTLLTLVPAAANLLHLQSSPIVSNYNIFSNGIKIKSISHRYRDICDTHLVLCSEMSIFNEKYAFLLLAN